jgi:hypothetical protein
MNQEILNIIHQARIDTLNWLEADRKNLAIVAALNALDQIEKIAKGGDSK